MLSRRRLLALIGPTVAGVGGVASSTAADDSSTFMIGADTDDVEMTG